MSGRCSISRSRPAVARWRPRGNSSGRPPARWKRGRGPPRSASVPFSGRAAWPPSRSAPMGPRSWPRCRRCGARSASDHPASSGRSMPISSSRRRPSCSAGKRRTGSARGPCRSPGLCCSAPRPASSRSRTTQRCCSPAGRCKASPPRSWSRARLRRSAPSPRRRGGRPRSARGPACCCSASASARYSAAR